MLVTNIFSNIVAAFIEVLVLNIFFSIFGEIRNKRTILPCLLTFILINVLALMLIKLQAIFISVTVLIIFIYTFQYKMSLTKRILATLFNFVLVVVAEILIGIIMIFVLDLTIAEMQTNSIIYLTNVTTSKLIIYVGARILKYYIKPKKERLHLAVIVPFLILPLSSVFILYALSEFTLISANANSNFIIFIAGVLLICANIATFLVYDYILKQKEDKSEVDRQILKLLLEQQYQTSLAEKQEESNRTIHDLKHKFYAIKDLLSTDKDKAIEKINEMCQIFEGMSSLKYTGLQSLDALINSKIRYAKEHGISMECKSIALGEYEIDVIDLCVIFGNLLDNSIEACTKIENSNKNIKVIIVQQGDYLSITITNDIPTNYTIDKDQKTSKEDKVLHGYGLINVTELIKKYYGIIKYGIEDGKYKVNIILKYE